MRPSTLDLAVAGRTHDERRAAGKSARRQLPRSTYRSWRPAADRPDPVAVLAGQGVGRVPELVPVRHGRMMASPFAFYRGAAAVMAADLADVPVSGLTVQLCGDAHLANFGVFGTPERSLIFDVNDFDETLPGPWEWDVLRLAASLEICGRQRGFAPDDRRAAVMASVAGYREHMAELAAMPAVEAFYDRLDAEAILGWVRAMRKERRASRAEVASAEDRLAKARTRDHLRAFSKLVEERDGRLRFRADPPLLVPVEDLAGTDHDAVVPAMERLLASYRSTLHHRHHVLDEYRYVHLARKVVGVGSVGTRCWVILLVGRDAGDPLILQAKEAVASVLERHLGPSEFAHHGERVVRGQRLMQAASDAFLGWQRVDHASGTTVDYYLRQLHDWKGSVDVDTLSAPGAVLYGGVCGQTLARAHARSGDRVAIAGYLGRADTFDRAVAGFAATYADRNEADHRGFEAAVASGRVEAVFGL